MMPKPRLLAVSFILSSLLFSGYLYANGVCVVNAANNTNLLLLESSVDVLVENQIALTKTRQVFRNSTGASTNSKYAFPLSESASAIELRWQVNGQWYLANISSQPPDTTLPGGEGGISQQLQDYLGATPLLFDLPQIIAPDSAIIVELTYVELLPYQFGDVDFSYPNDYSLIQSTAVNQQSLIFRLNSARSIESLQLLSSHNLFQLINTGNEALLETNDPNEPLDENYAIRYSLNLDQLGLFDFSTRIADSTLPDSLGGFLTFVAEPDPGNSTEVIDKVFTLVVDRSGSMRGNKIVQARNAARFIVENLNPGDYFNIVDFSSSVASFRSEHVPFNAVNLAEATNYINGFAANGGTNISGAFDLAVPQFASASDSTANIIIFFTDGQATVGITNTELLVNHITNLVDNTETGVLIFSFGIGTDANEQMLTLLSNANGGLAEFLGVDELFDRITDFYLRIRNPVLLNTAISFDPPVVTEVYPAPLPNLYQGQQMIVTGRYRQSGPVNVTLEGEAFGLPVSYQYALTLADTAVTRYQVLPKIWAKQKITFLLIEYYSLAEGDPAREAIRDQIVALSVGYGVISPFTGFSGGDPVAIDEFADDSEILAADFTLLGNYPNPFNPETTIRLKVNSLKFGIVKVKIYNALGQIVRVLTLTVNGPGQYEVRWDGRLQDGSAAGSGHYFYLVEFENTILAGKMTLLK